MTWGRAAPHHGAGGAPAGARLRRWSRRHRRVLAAAATGGAVLALGVALQPAPTGAQPVVIAARDLPAGATLRPDDLATAPVAIGVVPPGTTAEPADLVGHVLGTAVVRGEAVSSSRLVSSAGGSWAGPTGTSPLPVRFADAGAAALLAPGLRVDILAASAAGAGDAPGVAVAPSARLVASDVTVLAVISPDVADAGLLSTGPQGGAPLVVLAATPAEALGIAGAEAASRLTFTISGMAVPDGPR